MGHDISAYLGRIAGDPPRRAESDDEMGVEIAYLRGNWGIYEALGAEGFDGGVSGIGVGRWFSRAELLTGLGRLLVRDAEHNPAGQCENWGVGFLAKCLSRTSSERGWVYIEFG